MAITEMQIAIISLIINRSLLLSSTANISAIRLHGSNYPLLASVHLISCIICFEWPCLLRALLKCFSDPVYSGVRVSGSLAMLAFKYVQYLDTLTFLTSNYFCTVSLISGYYKFSLVLY